MICIEVALQTESSWHQAARKVLISLCKNPLVVSPILRACWGVSGAELPAALLQFLTMLGAATTPCALITLSLCIYLIG
ncbi:AEC family transporter [Pantoea coffeiphila]|uniref:AEC family transporter n=1 Tax=Pantoea coffeiphila TaxID=1465635 RepID=UPI00195F54D6|nr:AEC family transporter [Pantoea coffeiphila]MBM7344131.1 putative permease [Pantoea coffeiphila]